MKKNYFKPRTKNQEPRTKNSRTQEHKNQELKNSRTQEPRTQEPRTQEHKNQEHKNQELKNQELRVQEPMKKRIVVLTGAGISAESGLKTFRDADGLWENHAIEDVATPEAWKRNPELVLRFYNERRKAAFEAIPNLGHLSLVELEKEFDVQIITQNVDGLHEKAGSKNVLHLHGELSKVRSNTNEELVYSIDGDSIQLGSLAEDGSQLRPHIVWFGEAVPMMDKAIELTLMADILIIVGTSLQVYPAASLIQYVDINTPKYIIDPKPNFNLQNAYRNLEIIPHSATVGIPILTNQLLGK